MPVTTGKSGQEDSETIAWLDAERDYALGVHRGKLICRNPKGKKLATVPKWLKETELAEQLRAMADWLAEHQTGCLRTVELWMLRSLPVPRDVLLQCWPDPDWSRILRNLIVIACDSAGQTEDTQTGLLRDIDTKRGIGIVDRDGETQWLDAPQILIPHPILIDGLEDIREIAIDMDFNQSLEQMFRPTFSATEDQQSKKEILDFQNGKFEQLNYASSHCRRLGYPVRGGYACCRVWENSTPLEARYWIGSDYPEGETWTGDLIFVDEAQEPQQIAEVGPVTFSEGMRMASQIFAKRMVEKAEEGDE